MAQSWYLIQATRFKFLCFHFVAVIFIISALAKDSWFFLQNEDASLTYGLWRVSQNGLHLEILSYKECYELDRFCREAYLYASAFISASIVLMSYLPLTYALKRIPVKYVHNSTKEHISFWWLVIINLFLVITAISWIASTYNHIEKVSRAILEVAGKLNSEARYGLSSSVGLTLAALTTSALHLAFTANLYLRMNQYRIQQITAQ